MTKHPSYRARDQPESGSASQHRKDKIMHKFEKRDAKSRTSLSSPLSASPRRSQLVFLPPSV